VRLVRDEAAGDPEQVVDAPEDDEREGDDARERHAGEGDAAPGDLAATGGDTGAPVREPAGGASA
jgi:hypothetical protein